MRDSSGLDTWHTPAAAPSETRNYDATTLICFGLGQVGLAATGYALAVGFGIEHQIIELLTVGMP